MSTYFEWLSWWQMPITAIGSSLVTFLAVCVGFAIVLGLASYILHRL